MTQYLTKKDLDFLKENHKNVLKEILIYILDRVKEFLNTEYNVNNAKELKKLVEKVRDPCLQYKEQWGNFIDKVIAPLNLNEMSTKREETQKTIATTHHEILVLHSLCYMEESELKKPTLKKMREEIHEEKSLAVGDQRLAKRARRYALRDGARSDDG